MSISRIRINPSYVHIRHLPWIARCSVKTVRTPNLKISHISIQNGPIGVHRLKISTCSINGIFTKIRTYFKYIIMYVCTEFRPILIVGTKVIRVSSQKGVIFGISQFVQSPTIRIGANSVHTLHYDVCKVCANFRENPSDRACTKFVSKYAYGAILGRNVRNFQIGRPYSFHTAGGDSGQMTEMYLTIMT